MGAISQDSQSSPLKMSVHCWVEGMDDERMQDTFRVTVCWALQMRRVIKWERSNGFPLTCNNLMNSKAALTDTWESAAQLSSAQLVNYTLVLHTT